MIELDTPPEPRPSPPSTDVRGRLAERRARPSVRLRADPGREIALLVLFVAALGTLWVFSVGFKAQRFAGLGQPEDGTFWMESAQRFRYVRMVAAGEAIPEVDARMQAPDGYPTRADTILQEQLYGRLIARFAPAGADPARWTRLLTRGVSAASLLGVALLVLALTRRRDAALVAAAAFATALPVVERGTGAVIFREDLAVPVLALHLAAAAAWTRRARWAEEGAPDPLRPLSALAAGLLLAAFLLLWKVGAFYLLLFVGLLASLHWLGRMEPKKVALGGALSALPVAAACALPLSLQHDGFLASTPMLALAAVTLAAGVHALAPRLPRWAPPLLALGAFAAARVALPREAGLDHAWETIFAKLASFDRKPDDPLELSFHARHYWTGNYRSPTLERLLRDWPYLAAAALPGFLLGLRWWRTGGGPDAGREPGLPPPTRLLRSDGPSARLGPAASHFLLWLVVALVGSYLLFSKFQLFAALAAAACVGVGYAGFRLRGVRTLLRAALLVAVAATALHGWGTLPGLDRRVRADGPGAAEAWSRTTVFPSGAFEGLAEAVTERTGADDAVLASFVISPFLLTYLDRPTVLHCFFEGDLLPRFEEIVRAGFEDEEALWAAARRYGARWYVHEAHHLLRTDSSMSQRYVAGRMDWPHDSVLAAMAYAPERLERFELVWENGWFRLFRVLEPDERPGRVPRGAHALWSRPLFEQFFWDPLAEAGASKTGLEPEQLLYVGQKAEGFLRIARRAGAGTPAEREWALQRAAETAPYLPEPHLLLADFYRDRPDRAALHRRRAAALQAGLQGRAPLPADAVPTPLVLSP